MIPFTLQTRNAAKALQAIYKFAALCGTKAFTVVFGV